MDALPQDRGPAVEALRGVIDQLRTQQTQEAKAALARGLEALAELAPDADRARIRLDAAQAYTNAGDRDAARRMLAGLAEDRSASGQVAAGASAELVQVLIAEGQLEEAGRRLAEAGPALSGDDREALRLRLVAGWLKEGEVTRAEAALGADSTVEALALAGKIRLYHGDVAGAVDRLRKAGPYAGDRADATERTALLALLQPIESDSLALLGRGMLQLERGDTSHAVGTLEEVSADFPRAKAGRASRSSPADSPKHRGIIPMRNDCSTPRPRRRRPAPHPRRSWRWVSCFSRRIAPRCRRRNWSISFSRIPRVHSFPRLGGGSIRRAARCPRHETARISRTRGPDCCALSPALSWARLRRQRALAARADGRCPVRSPEGVRAHLSALLERGGGRSGCSTIGRVVPAPGDAGTARDAALNGVTIEALDDGQVVQIRGEMQDGNMDAVPLEKAPKVAVYAPPNAPPWDDAVTMALNYAGIEFEKVWDGEVLGAQAQDVRLAAPPPRGLHRAVLQVLPELRRRALARRDGGAQPRDGPAAGLRHRPGARRRRGRGDRAVRGARRLPLRDVHRDGDAGPGAGRRQRGHRRLLRRRHPDGPERDAQDATGSGRSPSRTRSWS